MMKIHAWAAMERGASLMPFMYEVGTPKQNECLIKVSACGICHSDIHMVDNDWHMSRYPLVPGHEVIGEVVEMGEGVTHLKKGDRVGVGWQQSACMQCLDCLQGNENLCDQNQALIVDGYGGFADHVLVDARFAFPIPSGISTQNAGPLLCGGATVYSALFHAGMSSGQEIGVIGIGGLGHLAVQFASRLGNRVTVFTTSKDKAELASRLGAHRAIIVSTGKPPSPPDRRLDLLLNTAPVNQDWPTYINYLNSDGTLVFVASPSEPVSIPIFSLLAKRRRLMASPIGGRAVITQMLSLAERFGIQPVVETFSFTQINEALQRVRDNKLRYRAVLLAE